MKPVHILIVDDDKDICESYCYFLESEGYTVFSTDNAKRAEEIALSEKIDVALLDLRMEGDSDGLLLNKEIKKNSPNLQTIIITAYTSYSTAVTALKDGVFDYLSKASSNDEMLKVIDKAVRKKQELDKEAGSAEPTNQTTITLICNHSFIKKGLEQFCSTQKDFRLNGNFKNFAELSLNRDENPSDISVFCSECNFKTLEDILLNIPKIKLLLGESKFILMNHNLTKEEESRLILSGISGFLPQNIKDAILATALNKIKNGEIWASRGAMSLALKNMNTHEDLPFPKEKNILTRREKEILRFVALEYQNKEISEKLFISESTVKTHLQNAFDKLEVRTRHEAVSKALQLNLLH